MNAAFGAVSPGAVSLTEVWWLIATVGEQAGRQASEQAYIGMASKVNSTVIKQGNLAKEAHQR
jgi:hypothetical protein